MVAGCPPRPPPIEGETGRVPKSPTRTRYRRTRSLAGRFGKHAVWAVPDVNVSHSHRLAWVGATEPAAVGPSDLGDDTEVRFVDDLDMYGSSGSRLLSERPSLVIDPSIRSAMSVSMCSVITLHGDRLRTGPPQPDRDVAGSMWPTGDVRQDLASLRTCRSRICPVAAMRRLRRALLSPLRTGRRGGYPLTVGYVNWRAVHGERTRVNERLNADFSEMPWCVVPAAEADICPRVFRPAVAT